MYVIDKLKKENEELKKKYNKLRQNTNVYLEAGFWFRTYNNDKMDFEYTPHMAKVCDTCHKIIQYQVDEDPEMLLAKCNDCDNIICCNCFAGDDGEFWTLCSCFKYYCPTHYKNYNCKICERAYWKKFCGKYKF